MEWVEQQGVRYMFPAVTTTRVSKISGGMRSFTPHTKNYELGRGRAGGVGGTGGKGSRRRGAEEIRRGGVRGWGGSR